jgi:pantoate kinase
MAAGRLSRTENACGNDARLIQNEHVAGAQVFREFVKHPVFDRAPTQNHEARCVARRHGLLCDKAARELERVGGG